MSLKRIVEEKDLGLLVDEHLSMSQERAGWSRRPMASRRVWEVMVASRSTLSLSISFWSPLDWPSLNRAKQQTIQIVLTLLQNISASGKNEQTVCTEAGNSGNCLAAQDGTHGVIRTEETPKVPTQQQRVCRCAHIWAGLLISITQVWLKILYFLPLSYSNSHRLSSLSCRVGPQHMWSPLALLYLRHMHENEKREQRYFIYAILFIIMPLVNKLVSNLL